MHTLEAFNIFLKPLNMLQLPYMVTGAAAAIIYGEPRMTLDLDVVVHIRKDDVEAFIDAFSEEEFYLPPEEVLYVEIGRPQRGHFNIIHFQTGLRADVYLMGNDPLHRWGLQHRKEFQLGDQVTWVAPPEYVIVRKLQYFQEGQSEKHLRDIRNMLEVSGEQIDHQQLERFINQYQLQAEWEQINPNNSNS